MQRIEPDYVVIGHVTKDLVDGRYTIGGTATYAAITAMRLGRTVGVVTSVASDLEIRKIVPGASVIKCDSPVDTAFENVYYPEGRIQFIRSVAKSISVQDVPKEWLSSRILHLGPVADEVDFGILQETNSKITAVTPQGWLRSWDESGRIHYRRWQLPPVLLSKISALIVSTEDIAEDPDFIRSCLDKVGVLVVTEGSNGARVYAEGRWQHFPAYPVQAIDPTGAGDVFAAAYFISLDENGDPFIAADFANCAASFTVERKGTEGIPTRSQIQQRLRREI